MTSVLALALIAGGLGALAALVTLMRSLRAAGLFDGNATLVFGLGLCLNAPGIVGELLGGRYTFVGDYGQVKYVAAPWVGTVEIAGLAATVPLGLAFATSSIRRNRELFVQPAVAYVIGILLLGTVASALRGGEVGSQRLVLMLMLLAAISLIRPSRGSLVGGATFAAALAVASALLYALAPKQATRPCRMDKCGPLGVLYDGVLWNENAFALALLLGVGALLYLQQHGGAVPLALFVSFSVVMTGSRSALVPLALTWAYFVHARMTSVKRHRFLASAYVYGGVLVMIAVPLMAGAGSFNLRPQVWRYAMARFVEDDYLGSGWDALELLVERTGGLALTSSYSVHNQLLDGVFTAGVLAGALTLALIRDRLRSTAGTMLLIAAVWAGILERPWNFFYADWLTWALVAVLLAPTTARHPSTAPPVPNEEPVYAR